jgi:hypothetical protein
MSDELPTCGPDGEQLAPEKFLRWLIPGVWEDTEGGMHLDVPQILSHLGIPDTEENRRLAMHLFATELPKTLPKAILEIRP